MEVPRRFCFPGANFSVGSKEFKLSMDFLERSTGIDAREMGTQVGQMPTKATCEALKSWEASWAEHGEHVEYDVEADVLRIVRDERKKSP